MPNWVINYLTVRTEDKDLIIGADRDVDFETLMPMPEMLHNTISGGHIEECMAYQYLNTHTKEKFVNSSYFRNNYAGLTKTMGKREMKAKLLESIGDDPRMYDSEFFDGKEHKHTPEEVGQYYLDLDKVYGCHNWYDWSIRNWGCKWNACNSDIVSEDDKTICFQFDTPWGCPDGWLEELAERIPFHLSWEEEQGYRGIITSHGNGIEINEELPMLEWEETEDGDYVKAEDEYGDDWTSLYIEDVFKKKG